MTDGELVRQALTGHVQAYEELVRRWAGRITALCHARVGCAAAADDLAQETLLRGYRSLDTLTDTDKFGPWLCQIANRTCLNWFKAQKRSPVAFSTLGPDQDPEELLYRHRHPDGEAADREVELEKLRVEVEALPAIYREVVLLYYHQKVTYQDLALLLDVSPATINARLTKARTLLRERLQSYCHR